MREMDRGQEGREREREREREGFRDGDLERKIGEREVN